MFQFIFIAGAVTGGYVVHKVHSTINKKPLKRLKKKMGEVGETVKNKFDDLVESAKEKIEDIRSENEENKNS